jgi:hypothetical protein
MPIVQPLKENGEDPMSVSLPNVLAAEEINVICHEAIIADASKYPSKSASGENFLLDSARSEFYDNMSEGSYRLGDHEPGIIGIRMDSQSDVTISSVNAPDPRLYSNTRFTTKRIGNVIVKKVTRTFVL